MTKKKDMEAKEKEMWGLMNGARDKLLEVLNGLYAAAKNTEQRVTTLEEMATKGNKSIANSLIDIKAYDVAKSYIDFLKERDSRAEFAKKAAQIKKKTANLRKGLASSNKDALKTLAKITGFSEKKEEKARTPIHEEAADAHGKP